MAFAEATGEAAEGELRDVEGVEGEAEECAAGAGWEGFECGGNCVGTGVEMVRTLYGTLCDYHANSAMLATTTTFSREEARDFEQKHKYQLALQDYTAMATWIQEYRTKPKP